MNIGKLVTGLFSNQNVDNGFKNTNGDRGQKIGSTIGNIAGSFIPGGEMLENLLGKFGSMFDTAKAGGGTNNNIAASSNPYGQMKNGGLIKYNGAKHENGGIPIGKNMQPTSRKNAIAEVEDGETAYNDYVFSDTLGINGKTFAKMSKKIENKYKGREDNLAKKTMNLELSKLMGYNEQERVKKEQVDNFRYGGDTQASDEMSGSGGVGDSSTPSIGQPTPNSILPPSLSKVPEDLSLKQNSSNILDMFGGLGDLFGGNNNAKKYPTIGDSFKMREQVTSAKIPNQTPQVSKKPISNIGKSDDKLAINYNNQHFNDKLPTAKNGGKLNKYPDGGAPLEDINIPTIQSTGLGKSIMLNPNEKYLGSEDGFAIIGDNQPSTPEVDKPFIPMVQNDIFGNYDLPTVDNPSIDKPGSLKHTPTDIPNVSSNINIGQTVRNMFSNSQNNPQPNGTTSEDAQLTEEGKKGLHYLTPAIIGKGAELLGKGAMLAKGYDRVDPNYNRYEGKVKDIMSKRAVDMDAVINQINLARNARLKSNQNARSLNVKRSLDNQTYTNTAQQVSQAELQKQQINNQLRGEEARQLDTLGQQRVQSETYAEDAEARNKGQFFTNMGTFLGDIGRAGAFGSKYLANDYKSKEMLELLNNAYEDFGVSKELVERLNNGTATDEDMITLKKAETQLKNKSK